MHEEIIKSTMKTCRKGKPISPPGKLAYEEDIFVCTISMTLRTSCLRASDDDDACLFSKQSVRSSPIKSPSRAAKKQSTTRGRKQEASRQHVQIERSRKKVEERKRKRSSCMSRKTRVLTSDADPQRRATLGRAKRLRDLPERAMRARRRRGLRLWWTTSGEIRRDSCCGRSQLMWRRMGQ